MLAAASSMSPVAALPDGFEVPQPADKRQRQEPGQDLLHGGCSPVWVAQRPDGARTASGSPATLPSRMRRIPREEERLEIFAAAEP